MRSIQTVLWQRIVTWFLLGTVGPPFVNSRLFCPSLIHYTYSYGMCFTESTTSLCISVHSLWKHVFIVYISIST